MTAAAALPQRLASLDAFRGLAIAGMVLVNNPGDWSALYRPLAHAAWHGWTFTDTIFPFFLFIVGVSMTLSLGRRAAAGAGTAALLGGMARRCAVIFGVGLLLNLIPHFDLATVRVPGVLQRIALCSLLAAPLVLACRSRGLLLAIVLAFAAYSVPMLALPVPDASGTVAAGVLEPGRDAGAWLDRLLLGGHLWAAARTWDPEGLLSTLPALGTLLFGALAGRGLATPRPALEHTVWLLLAGLGLLGLGTLMDGLFMPINKNLWTPSYAVFMAGWALLVFGACHALLDAVPQPAVRRWAAQLAQPLVIYGLNALFIFALSGLVGRLLVTTRVQGQTLKAVLYAPVQALGLSPVNSSLLWALVFNALMFGVAWCLWRRRWFIKA